MMTEFYTQVHTYGNYMYVRGFNADGSRMQKRFRYDPYLFVPSNVETGYTDIYGNPVQKKYKDEKTGELWQIWDARQYIKKFQEVEGFNVYGLDRFDYVHIYEKYRDQVVDTSKINIVNIDIEVASDDGTLLSCSLGNVLCTAGLLPAIT